MKDVTNKTEIFKDIDVIYKKMRYKRRNNKPKEKEIWEELFESIPYNYILESEEILELIVNLCKENYKENLNEIKLLINKIEDTKYLKNEIIPEQMNSEEKIENQKNTKVINTVKTEERKKTEDIEYWIDVNFNSKDENVQANNEVKDKSINYSLDIIKNDNIKSNLYNQEKSIYENTHTDNIEDTLENIRGNINPERKEIKLNKIIRNSSIVKTLKKIYNNTCQICGTRLEIGVGTYYSEVHHIRPLGKLHKGNDTTDNAIVLCPNCHTLFDKGSIGINPDTFRVIYFNENSTINDKQINFKHEIDIENIKYHNTHIYLGGISSEIENTTNNIETKTMLNNISVDYGDTVEILDLELNEPIVISVKSYWEKNEMPPLQKILINKRIRDIVTFNRYKYRIVKIEKYLQ